MAFRQFKLRVRKTVSLSYSGPESLEDIVLDYIVRHEDLYDVQTTVNVREREWCIIVFHCVMKLKYYIF